MLLPARVFSGGLADENLKAGRGFESSGVGRDLLEQMVCP